MANQTNPLSAVLARPVQTPAAVKIGNYRSDKVADVSAPGCRNAAQHRAVMALHRKVPSAHWCGNPFEQRYPGQRFKGSFMHTFYDAQGYLRAAWVTPEGGIEIGEPDGEPNLRATAETLAKYGAFNGA